MSVCYLRFTISSQTCFDVYPVPSSANRLSKFFYLLLVYRAGRKVAERVRLYIFQLELHWVSPLEVSGTPGVPHGVSSASVPILTVALNMVNRLALSLGCLNRLRPAAAKATRTELPRPRPVWYIAPVFSSGNVASIVTTLTIGVSLALYDYTTLTTAHRTQIGRPSRR